MEREIKIIIAGRIDSAKLMVTDYIISFEYQDIILKEQIGNFPVFSVLKKIRQELEKSNILLLINASRIDVWPSGMSSMGNGAYIHRLGESSLTKDLVGIYEDAADTTLIGTIEQQSAFIIQYRDSLLNKP